MISTKTTSVLSKLWASSVIISLVMANTPLLSAQALAQTTPTDPVVETVVPDAPPPADTPPSDDTSPPADTPPPTDPGSGDQGDQTIQDSVQQLLAPLFAPLAAIAEPDVVVHISKYIDGPSGEAPAAPGAPSFPMSATWNATNIGSGTGSYSLDTPTYSTQTTSMSAHADYATNEVTDGNPVVATDGACSAGKYRLVGYQVGSSFEDALTKPITPASPSFTNLTSDEYVIVVNEDCAHPLPPPPPPTPPCNLLDNTTFDTFALGNVNGQFGWSSTGSFDQAVVNNTYGYPTFGCKSLRISDAVTSGSFGDQTFSYSVPNKAGETGALDGGVSGGTLQNHFDAQFDIASTMAGEQSGMHMSVSPDRGDGARMSYLRFEDQSDGIHVFFDDYSIDIHDFNETYVTTLDRAVPHTIKFSMDFVDGPGNDVVKIYIDSAVPTLVGTSWEDYFRDNQPENAVPTVDSLLFRESAGGDNHPANAGNGFLLDNFSISSSNVEAQSCKLVSDDQDTYIGFDKATHTFTHPAWSTQLNADGAQWVWDAYHVTDPTNPQTVTFTRSFNVTGSPGSATLQIAADNSYAVTVNGNPVPACDGSGDSNFAAVDNCTVPIVSGPNTITFTVTNAATPNDSDPEHNPAGLYYEVNVANATCEEAPPVQTLKVHILKYLQNGDSISPVQDGAGLPDFPMTSTWQTANLNGGEQASGSYVLGTNFGGSSSEYGADTSPMDAPADYTTSETTDGSVVVASENECSPGKYVLVGYKSGNTQEEAATSEVTSTDPIQYTDITTDRYILVINKPCPDVPPPPPSCVINSDTTTLEGGESSFLAAFIHSSWTAIINGASWIWGDAAIVDPVGTETQVFTKDFTLDSVPVTGGTLTIAADNGYSVKMNGIPVGADPSEDNYTDGAKDTIVIPAADLIAGNNQLEITVTNLAMAGGTQETNPAGLKYNLTIEGSNCTEAPPTMKVHIFKYLQDGDTAAQVPNDADAPLFPMKATYSIAGVGTNLDPGDDYQLGNGGGVGGSDDGLLWAANTIPLHAGDTYGTHEVVGGDSPVVDNSEACTEGKYLLLGYKTGDTLAEAQGASINPAAPNYGSIDGSKYVIVVNEDCDNILNDGGGDEPQTQTIIVTGDTSPSENTLGWMFNRDTSTQTPFAFNNDTSSIGSGSLFVPAITNTVNGDSDKFIGELFLQKLISDVNSISYDFNIAAPDAAAKDQFYMSVYADFGVSSPTKFYDCRYSVIPTAGSVGSFMTATFDPTQTYLVAQSGSSPAVCPSSPAAMGAGATIRAISLNVGDTSGSDTGVSGYLDNVVVNTPSLITTYDFEPAAAPETTTGTGSSSSSGGNRTNGSGPGNGQVLGESTDGQVLGNSCPLLTQYMREGITNDPTEVTKLQTFLNGEMGSLLPVSGFFGHLTTLAVDSFQVKYASEVLAPWVPFGYSGTKPTGYVFKTTEWKINSIACPELNIPFPALP